MSGRWLRAWWTAHRLRVLLAYGLCPLCDSSPPDPTCPVCLGGHRYGPRLAEDQRALWAARYVEVRAQQAAP